MVWGIFWKGGKAPPLKYGVLGFQQIKNPTNKYIGSFFTDQNLGNIFEHFIVLTWRHYVSSMGGAKKTPDIWWYQQTSSLMISSDIIGYLMIVDDIWRYPMISENICWYLMIFDDIWCMKVVFCNREKSGLNPLQALNRESRIERQPLVSSHFLQLTPAQAGLETNICELIFWFCKPMALADFGKIFGMVSMWILVFIFFK